MRYRRQRRGAKRTATGVAGVLLAAATGAAAGPFDAVVPATIQIDTTAPAYRIDFYYWGWIAATADSLTALDLDTAVIQVETEATPATIDHGPFENGEDLAPLRAGEVAGLRLHPWNSAFDTLLVAGEALKASGTGFFSTAITFPAGYTDTVTVTTTLTMAGEALSYTTTVIFGELGLLLPLIVEGQRIASAPVPSSTEAATWGSLKTRFLPRR
jgi:hypothetical protein